MVHAILTQVDCNDCTHATTKMIHVPVYYMTMHHWGTNNYQDPRIIVYILNNGHYKVTKVWDGIMFIIF